MDPFLGEIRIFAGSYAPTGWAFCDGSLIGLASNPALFSLFGTKFGGDGKLTFGLPDLRDRLPLGSGSAPGLSTYTQGQMGGVNNVTLSVNQLPGHTHSLNVSAGPATTATPSDSVAQASTAATVKMYTDKPSATGNYATFSPAAINSSGQGQPHENMMPSVGLNFIVALRGIFPSR